MCKRKIGNPTLFTEQVGVGGSLAGQQGCLLVVQSASTATSHSYRSGRLWQAHLHMHSGSYGVIGDKALQKHGGLE